MSHASNAPESTDEQRSGLSRRTVVRTAAWSAPAVTVAVAAPAFANSLVDDIVNPTFSTSLNGRIRTVSGITVTNDGPNVLAAGTVRITFIITGGNTADVWDQPVVSAGSSWAAVAGSVGTKTLVFTYNAAVPLGTVSLPGILAARSGNGSGVQSVTLTYAP